MARIVTQQAGQIAASVLIGGRLPPPGAPITAFAAMVPGPSDFPRIGEPGAGPSPQTPPPLTARQRQLQDERRLRQLAESEEAGDEPLDREVVLARGGGGGASLIELRRFDNGPASVGTVLIGAGNSSLWMGADGTLDFSPE